MGRGAVGANGEGYRNSFTDAVSTEPVTDRASMIAAYTARMTYGFTQTGDAGQAARVPENAANLLLTAFPELTDEQRSQVLAASEIDSGYPLDASSEGYQRINLAKAFSANVTLSSDRSTVLDITFGNAAPTVTVQSDDTQQGGSPEQGGENPGQDGDIDPSTGDGSDQNGEQQPADEASAGKNDADATDSKPLAQTGVDMALPAAFAVLVAGAGLALTVERRRRR